RRAKAKIDAEGIALLGALLEQLGYARGEANRRLPRLLARPARQVRRIVKEDEIDVGRIVQLAAAELAERDRREAARARVRGALGEGGGDRLPDRPVRQF